MYSVSINKTVFRRTLSLSVRRFYVIVGFVNCFLHFGCGHGPSQTIQALKIRPFIEKIADSIARYNVVHSHFVGFAGVTSIQWLRYDTLRQLATSPELRLLTNNPNATVRCYAFEALAKKNDSAVYNILINHLTDSAKAKTLSGCIAGSRPVGDYFLSLVYSDESANDCYTLNVSQKKNIDSLLLYSKNVSLWAKDDLIRGLKPLPKYYARLRILAEQETNPFAAQKLAEFKREQDVPIITRLFSKKETEFNAINAAVVFPHVDFYNHLIAIARADIDDKEHIDNDWFALCQALAQYPCSTTTALFLEAAQNKDKYIQDELINGIKQAIAKHPNPIYLPISQRFGD